MGVSGLNAGKKQHLGHTPQVIFFQNKKSGSSTGGAVCAPTKE
jgi:hypothetical protein